MRKNNNFAKRLAVISVMSLFLVGCGAKDNNSTDITNGDTTEMTEENNTTKESTEAEAETKDEKWENGKVSGSEEDFNEYFNIDTKIYTAVCDRKGEVTKITYYSEVMGTERQAQVYTPYNYDENEEYPVVYLIHGLGCDSGQWVGMGANRIFDNMIDKGEIKPFIAVFPSVVPADGLDSNTFSDSNINAFKDFVEEFKTDLEPYIKDNYSVSEKWEDTAICGLSMGGMEALRLGFTYSDKFCYIGSFSAAPTLETELLTTENSEYIPKLVLLCTGGNDSTVGDNPFNYHETLANNNVDHIWYIHPGESHSAPVWKLGLINFLKRVEGGFAFN